MNRPLTWADHYELATAHLKLTPGQFWQLTPMEFERLCVAHLKTQAGYVEPVTWQQFDDLRKRFPDTPPQETRVH